MLAMQALSFRSTYKLNGLSLARNRLQHRAVATNARTTASVSQAALNPSDVSALHVPTVRAAALTSAGPQLPLSAAPVLHTGKSVSHPVLEQLTPVPMLKAVGSKSVSPQNLPRSAAAILHARTSVSHPASDPLENSAPRVPIISAAPLPSARPQQLLPSATATSRTTASVSHLALNQLDVMKLNDRHSRQPRQPIRSEDTSTGLGPTFENRAVFKLFTTESAKHHACVEVAEMLHKVSGSVFQMVLKQLPGFCTVLNSVAGGYAKPLAIMDAMSGGGPHCKPWRDHEEVDDCERMDTTPRTLAQEEPSSQPIESSSDGSSSDELPTPNVISYYWRVY
ncbi:hypothetical protein MMC07_003143 [Pseudocyphellaria aurata]|nr:hypothetical protein [Pseudocyphellaria aurata]